MKVCTKCKIEKDESEFFKNKNKKHNDGLEYICKKCKNEYNIAKGLVGGWQQKNPEKNKEKKRQNLKKQIDRLSDSYLKKMARKRGFTEDQVEKNPDLLEVIKSIIKIKRLCKGKRGR